MVQAIGYATKSSFLSLKPFPFVRLEPGRSDVLIEIKYCGICHSDVHQARNEWNNTIYPCMPGHEIIGEVTRIGKGVKKFKVGELVGVGCMIDSCQECASCKEGLEQYCEKGCLNTYNGNMHNPTEKNNTFGGFSSNIVVREDFVLKLPKNLDPSKAGPLLCAGITTYSPLKHWKVGKGTKVGIVGFGGLGHMATKIAVALGAEVTVITSKKEKSRDAHVAGAKHVLVSKDERAMERHKESLEFILNTIPQPHDANPFLELLKRDGVMTIVGCIAPLSKPLDIGKMIKNRRELTTSLIGGIKETQEMLNFCSKHNILPNTKMISIDEVNDAFDKLNAGEVDFRYVIDMSTLPGINVEETNYAKVTH